MDNGKESTHRPDFTGLKELAGKLGTSYRTVHRAAQSGKIKTVRFGSLVKVSRQEVERILARGF